MKLLGSVKAAVGGAYPIRQSGRSPRNTAGWPQFQRPPLVEADYRGSAWEPTVEPANRHFGIEVEQNATPQLAEDIQRRIGAWVQLLFTKTISLSRRYRALPALDRRLSRSPTPPPLGIRDSRTAPGEGEAAGTVREGTAVLFPQGSTHMLQNTGPQEMKVVCFFAPASDLSTYRFIRSGFSG
jgi:hypothetical protein